ncbi:MAG: flagellar biosynthesis anti-sigma factor FlgM [Lachnospiraceae bacterium]|nr:flagellar biosynthesis anti-sigma factor FlgM [Lachnospiraceae bacterium]
MRIDSTYKPNQIYKTNNAKRYNATSSYLSFNDSVEISQLGKDIQVAKQAVKAAPDVREDKVAAMKAAFANGTYSVSDDQLADKLLESFDI